MLTGKDANEDGELQAASKFVHHHHLHHHHHHHHHHYTNIDNHRHHYITFIILYTNHFNKNTAISTDLDEDEDGGLEAGRWSIDYLYIIIIIIIYISFIYRPGRRRGRGA